MQLRRSVAIGGHGASGKSCRGIGPNLSQLLHNSSNNNKRVLGAGSAQDEPARSERKLQPGFTALMPLSPLATMTVMPRNASFMSS